MAHIPLHTPARQPGESQAAYRQRRAASARAVREVNAAARSNRSAPSSRAQLRNAQRRNGALKSGAFGAAIIAAAARKARDARERRGLRDAHGAVTQTGGVTSFVDVPRDPRWVEHGATSDGCWHGRRKWLAGISAQRGY